MPTLSTDKQSAVLSALVEGASIRSTERMTGVSRNAIGKLVQRVGKACERVMDEEIRNVRCEHVELDEVWAFVGKKRNHVRRDDDPERVGDFWTWVGLDPDTKLVPAYHVGKRTMWDAQDFARLLRRRIDGRVQISTDKLLVYRAAILGEFSERAADGSWVRPDWGTIVKRYAVEPSSAGRYSPPHVVATDKRVESGNPDPDRISTSHVERSHLTMRMSMRRLTRLTNGFSKKPEALKAAVALHFAHYNLVRKHSTIKTTPAVAAGVSEREWKMADLVDAGMAYGYGR